MVDGDAKTLRMGGLVEREDIKRRDAGRGTGIGQEGGGKSYRGRTLRSHVLVFDWEQRTLTQVP